MPTVLAALPHGPISHLSQPELGVWLPAPTVHLCASPGNRVWDSRQHSVLPACNICQVGCPEVIHTCSKGIALSQLQPDSNDASRRQAWTCTTCQSQMGAEDTAARGALQSRFLM